MALNSFVTRQEVLNAMNAAFQPRAFLLDYANKTLVDRTTAYNIPTYGNGQTIKVRKRSVTRGVTTNISLLNGPMTKTIQPIEQETIDLTVDTFYNATFQLNAVNQKLFLNGEAANVETVDAAANDLVFRVQKYLYDHLILSSNILALSPASSLNTQDALGQIGVVAKSNNMPEDACLMVSNTALNNLSSHFGVYLNQNASTPALKNTLPGFGLFSEIKSDNVVENYVTGTAINSTVTPVLSVAAVNGDTALTIDFTAANAGLTIIVGDPLTATAADVFSIARGTYQRISQSVNRPSFIAADIPAGTVNADFTPPVIDVFGNIVTKGFYTVPVGGVVTISIGQTVATSGNFQTIEGPAATIPIGTPITFYDDHVASFMVARTGISFASPRIVEIENATNTYSTHNDLSLRFATQGSLLTETNQKEIAAIWGQGMDNFYLIRVMSNN